MNLWFSGGCGGGGGGGSCGGGGGGGKKVIEVRLKRYEQNWKSKAFIVFNDK